MESVRAIAPRLVICMILTLLPVKLARGLDPIAMLTPGGSAVDVSGGRIVIGQRLAEVGPFHDAGEVYVYEPDGEGWTLDVTLTASDAVDYDNFGGAVALDGDVLAVGAPATDFQFYHEGAVYIFRLQGGTWVEEVKLTSGISNPDDDFGLAIDIENGRLAVGNRRFGYVYVYRYDGDVWVEEAQLRPADFPVWGGYAQSVALSGEWLVAGSPIDNEEGDDAGSAFVFRRDGTVWTEEAKLLASDASENDLFGSSVAIDGSFIAIGAPRRIHEFFHRGSVYVYQLIDSSWEEQVRLGPPAVEMYGQGGSSVGLCGSILVAGAPYDGVDGQGTGAAYLFKRLGDQWYSHGRLIPSSPAAGDRLGYSVAVDGTLGAMTGQFTDPAYAYDVGEVSIPTVSNWGLSALALIILIGGTIRCRRMGWERRQGALSRASLTGVTLLFAFTG